LFGHIGGSAGKKGKKGEVRMRNKSTVVPSLERKKLNKCLKERGKRERPLSS